MTKITRTKVQKYLLKAYCDCGGEMIFGGIGKTCYPMLYVHKCDLCQTVQDLDRQYPYLSYEETK